MNIYSLDDTTVILDLAHNEAGLDALLEVMNGLRAPGGRTLLGLGTAGDRTDEIVHNLGEVAARDADVVVIVHKKEYLRGRDPEDLNAIYREGAAKVGVSEIPAYDSELDGLQALVARAAPGDVVAVMCHQDRELVDQWLVDRGATVDTPEVLRDKVLLATNAP
jgi:cyanophycin synthetase